MSRVGVSLTGDCPWGSDLAAWMCWRISEQVILKIDGGVVGMRLVEEAEVGDQSLFGWTMKDID